MAGDGINEGYRGRIAATARLELLRVGEELMMMEGWDGCDGPYHKRSSLVLVMAFFNICCVDTECAAIY